MVYIILWSLFVNDFMNKHIYCTSYIKVIMHGLFSMYDALDEKTNFYCL